MFLRIYYYENFSLPDNFVSTTAFVWMLYIGFMLAMTAATVDKLYCLRFIKALTGKGAVTDGQALPLDAPETGGKWYLRFALKPGKHLTKMVSCIREEKEVRYYLPEENRIRAELRYDNGEHPIRSLILCGAILLLLAILMQTVLPELLQMLDNLISEMKAS